MAHPPFRPFHRRAERLFERGIAAAQGGQRMVAAALLRQVVRLEPDHEQAWLWLSGVLDDREDIAFCLRAVLSINPENERARVGLAQLDSWEKTHPSGGPSTSDYLRNLSAGGSATRGSTAPWWMSWRDARLAARLLLALIWLVPLVLIGVTGTARTLLAWQPLPTFPTYRDYAPTAVVVVAIEPEVVEAPATVPTTAPTPSPSAGPGEAGQPVEPYLQEIRTQRQRLRQAVDAYRAGFEGNLNDPQRVTAVRQLHEEVAGIHTVLASLDPPDGAEVAHQAYLGGLVLEQEALQELLAFYESYDAAAANRAAQRMLQARTLIASATAEWDAFALRQAE
jgi:hypothetical protein